MVVLLVDDFATHHFLPFLLALWVCLGVRGGVSGQALPKSMQSLYDCPLILSADVQVVSINLINGV